MSGVPVVVSCRWLKDAVTAASKKDLRVLETMLVPKAKGYESFLKERIPTARYIDMWDSGVNPTQYQARPLPNMAAMARQLEAAGVSDSNHCVLYSKSGTVFSVRMWLQCRDIGLKNVSVLDGGFNVWQQNGYPVESGEPQPVTPGNITVRRQQSFCGLQETSVAAANGSRQFVDVRKPGNFLGVDAEPSESTMSALKSVNKDIPRSMLAGHIRGARNIPYGTLLDSETGCFKSDEELLQILEKAGVDINKPTVTHCYNGMTACYIPLVAAKLGANVDNCKVFVGSWTEFGQQGASDLLEKGDAKPLNKADDAS